jgi:hypothetical protein
VWRANYRMLDGHGPVRSPVAGARGRPPGFLRKRNHSWQLADSSWAGILSAHVRCTSFT